MVTGANVAHVSGTTHLPIPQANDLLYRRAHAPQPKKPAGLDWDAITPTCTSCGQRSGRLRDTLCPTCADPLPEPAPAPTPRRRSAGPRKPREPREPRPPRAPRPRLPYQASTNVSEIRRLYLHERLSIPQVSEVTGHARGTVRKILLDAGITLRDDRRTRSGGANRIDAYPADLVDNVRRLYLDQGLTQATVARRLGVSTKVVQNVMAKHNIPARPDAFSPGGRGRANPIDTLKARIAELGTTSRDIKEWALREGLILEISVGLPSRRLIEKYAAAGIADPEPRPQTLEQRDAEIRQFATAAPAFAVRIWAIRHGHRVGDRGPIPFETRIAYATEHYDQRRCAS